MAVVQLCLFTSSTVENLKAVLRMPAVIGCAVEEQHCLQVSLLASLHVACQGCKNKTASPVCTLDMCLYCKSVLLSL